MKHEKIKHLELLSLIIIYGLLFCNAIIMKDSLIAFISAFCGITYTIMAGKGNPICYIYGIIGSSFYCYLSLKNALWGNLLLYSCYYVPMQIFGFFQWNKNLKNKSQIIKTKLDKREGLRLLILTVMLNFTIIAVLYIIKGKSPIIDGITTILSITGMYLTVKRCIEQWFVWFIVNFLSFIMWLKIALNGQNVYSTVIMWFIYTILSIYFYKQWRKEINNLN